jgi:hypothetical protein
MAITIMITWGFNYVVSKITPMMILSIGYKTWLVGLLLVESPIWV